MTEITAKSIFNSLKENCNVKELGIYLCGGGSKNLFLMDLIKSKLPKKWKLYTTEALGIDPMLVETSTFTLTDLNVSYCPLLTDNGLGYFVSKTGEQLTKVHVWGCAQLSDGKCSRIILPYQSFWSHDHVEF